VSFDGADTLTFEKIRRGSNFERICDSVSLLNRIYEDTPLDIAPATYTSIQRDNQSELVRIVKMVTALGFRRIGFGIVTAPEEFAPHIDNKLCRELQDAYHAAEQNELFIELFPTKLGEFVYNGDKYVPTEDFIVRTRCDAPFVNAVIQYDGTVCLCCNYGASVGNVENDSFLKIWQSSNYNELREAVNDLDNMPKPCRRCWWVNRW
ncbi:MAG: SPASM domain-containing protein, partial [Oscillospiraceae bacterium]|nr:SPASM domain-containing protein [Oscillospiraceae bacterium]